MKKQTALFLALLLIASLSTACSEKTTSSEVGEETVLPSAEQNPGEPETPAEEEETVIPLGIPEEDNGGRDFHVLVPTEKAYEFVTESTGEVVNDAILGRSQKTEELFGLSFSYQYELGGWDTRDSYNNFIKNAVLAGDTTYDLATGYIVCSLPLYLQGSLMDFTTVEDLSLDNPWWMNGLYDDLNIDGHLFCVFGDANLSVYKDCSVILKERPRNISSRPLTVRLSLPVVISVVRYMASTNCHGKSVFRHGTTGQMSPWKNMTICM